MRAGQRQNGVPSGCTTFGPQIAQQVEHDGRGMLAWLRERQTRQRAHLQLKLRLVASVQRVVAAVVWARCHLVDDQLAAFEDEKLHTQHAHVMQAFGNGTGGGHGLRGQVGGHSAFVHAGHGQNAFAVQVQLDREIHHLPIGPTRHNDRAFGLEGQHFFKHTGHVLELIPGGAQFFTALDADLAFAVVAHAGGLEDAREELIAQSGQLLWLGDDRVGRHRHAAAHKMGFFGRAVLRNGHGIGTRGHRAVCAQRDQRGRGHVFKFGGDGGAALHQLGQALLVQVIGLDVVVAHQPGRTGGVGVEHGGEIPHGLRCVHEHAAKLSAAHHAQGGGLAVDDCARQHHFVKLLVQGLVHAAPTGGKVMARAMAVCSARKASSF